MNRKAVCRWHLVLAERLHADGFDVGVNCIDGRRPDPIAAALVALEPKRFGAGLALTAPPPAERLVPAPEFVVDLSDSDSIDAKTVSLGVGSARGLAGLPSLLVAGAQPHLVVSFEGRAVAEAIPMVRDRLWLGRAMEDVLARAISLVRKALGDLRANRLETIEPPDVGPAPPSGFAGRYVLQLAMGVASRAAARRSQHGFYWRTGLRPAERRSVADTCSLTGAPWSALPDDGKRFYADPFLFFEGGRTFLFLEEYPYDLSRGLISVTELGEGGAAATPRTVLDEPWHLSYPQVFSRDGEIWMIPETSAEQKVMLYRAAPFPDRWVREAVLIEGAELSDATLLEHEGRLWLFASGRDGYGSGSDMMMVYSAPRLTGPWTPHPRNPVLIDCRRARPGGSFVASGGKLYLPVQDGSVRYGGGLGFAELIDLGEDRVRFAPPRPVTGAASWSAEGLHTYNRAGGFEVVDGFAELRR